MMNMKFVLGRSTLYRISKRTSEDTTKAALRTKIADPKSNDSLILPIASRMFVIPFPVKHMAMRYAMPLNRAMATIKAILTAAAINITTHRPELHPRSDVKKNTSNTLKTVIKTRQAKRMLLSHLHFLRLRNDTCVGRKRVTQDSHSVIVY